MFSFRQSRFGGGEDPWFRLGTFDVGSAGIAALAAATGILLWAAEGPSRSISRWLIYQADDVQGGQIWRLVTWFVPNEPSLWPLLSAVIIYYLGSQLEGALGRVKMAQFLVVLVLIPTVVALLLDLFGVPGTPSAFWGANLLSSAIFYSFIAFLPTARFFFGIPGWVLGAVFFGLQVLEEIGNRNTGALILLVARVAFTLLAAKAFGLADDVHWIPDLRRNASGRASRSARPSRSRRFSRGPDLTVIPSDNFDQMGIDEILDQVSAHGVDSLSAEQKKRLKAYSKRRKKG